MKPTVIIFDWDDTLLDIGPQLCQSQHAAIIAYSDPHRFPFLSTWHIPDYAAIQQHIGQRFVETILPALVPLLDPQDREQAEWIAAVNYDFRARYKARPKALFPGVSSSLQALHEAGFLLAIATNKSRDLFTAEYEAIAPLLPPLSHIVCGDDEVVNGNYKPQPDMINWIQEQYPSHTQFVMVGDRISDMTAAQRSNRPTKTVFVHPDTPAVDTSLCLHSVQALSPSLIKQL
jgi:phosphoglycolate phosphatase